MTISHDESLEADAMERDSTDHDSRLAASWVANADAWTEAVRGARIPSRRAGTDAAIVAAVLRAPPGTLLDVGCGEGWLARILARHGWQVVGVDASPPLVARAAELGGGDFRVASYDALVADPSVAGGPFDVAVLNFALLAERIVPVLVAVACRLTGGGTMLIQTVHPWTAAADGPYEDGWRRETFVAFGGAFPASMPWYFRTLASWIAALREAGLEIERIEEPRDPATGQPLSLLVTCRTRPVAE